MESRFDIENLEIYLKELYINQTKTAREISQIIYGKKTNSSSILNWLHYYNIPLRKGSEAIKTQYIGDKGIVRKESASKNAMIFLQTQESRDKLRKAMQTDEYKLKQKISKLGEGNGMYGVVGEVHPQWNPNRTHDQRVIERKTFKDSRWRKEVFERDKYICQCCGYDKGNILVSHHLNSYDIYISERQEVDNGITVCETCHKLFHHQYGYGNNTKDQYIEFVKFNKQLALAK